MTSASACVPRVTWQLPPASADSRIAGRSNSNSLQISALALDPEAFDILHVSFGGVGGGGVASQLVAVVKNSRDNAGTKETWVLSCGQEDL